MRILLDECLPRRLKTALAAHDCVTVPEAGLSGKQNGELLALAEKDFEVFLTIDRGLPYQQNLATYRIALVILAARSNRFAELEPLLPRILDALNAIKAGQVVHVGR